MKEIIHGGHNKEIKQELKKEEIIIKEVSRVEPVLRGYGEPVVNLIPDTKVYPRLKVSGLTMLSPSTNRWESYGAFNPAAIYDKGKVHLLYRAIGDTNKSVMGYASSSDGHHIDERLSEPVFEMEGTDENLPPNSVTTGGYCSGGGLRGGCEDPRITKIDNRFYVPFVYFDGSTPPRLALTSIKVSDFRKKNWVWKEPVFMSPPGVIDKNPAILPEKINGKYVVFHRIFPSILIDFLDDLEFDGSNWMKGEFSINPTKNGWDSRKLGVGPTPIKTKEGWLVIYHAVDDKCPFYNYKIGAMLLDLKNPTKVLHRCTKPILEPQKDDRNIIYPCGAVVMKGTLFVYYGSRDATVKVATANLNDFLKALTSTENAELTTSDVFEI